MDKLIRVVGWKSFKKTALMRLFKKQKRSKAFTLVEILVVIAIIGILSSVVTVSVRSAVEKAKVAKAHSEMRSLYNAILLMYEDTGLYPNKRSNCMADPEVYLNVCSAGMQCTDGGFPNWNGPYFTAVPKDAWGRYYHFDGDYQCNGNMGCEAYPSGTWVSAIHSLGPNGVLEYGGDDIVKVVCKP